MNIITASLSISDRNEEMWEITPTSLEQGRTLNGDERYCAAARAIDGDLSTRAATHTDNGAGWLKMTFDKTYFIHKLVIYYQFFNNWYHSRDSCVQTVETFEECVDNDNNVDVSVYQGEVKQKSCGTLQLTYGLEQSNQIYTLLCNNEGNIVKLSKDNGNIVVFEIAVTSKCRAHFQLIISIS